MDSRMSRRSLGKGYPPPQAGKRRPSEGYETPAHHHQPSSSSAQRQSRTRIPKTNKQGRSNSCSKSKLLKVTPTVVVGRSSSVSSFSSGGRESYMKSGSRIVVKDSRPLQDKTWQHTTERKLSDLLKKLGYPSILTSKSFPLSSTEFRKVFNFMFGVLSPGYTLPPKFEAEVPMLAKAMGYPGVLSKSSFITLGSLHSWPSVLGLLDFLRVCIVEMNEKSNSQILFMNMDENGETKDDDEIDFDFYTTAYEAYRDDENKDTFQEELEILRQNYLVKYNVNEDHLDKIRENVAFLEAELKKLESEPNHVEELQKKYSAYMTDYKILTEFIEKLKGYITKREKQLKEAEERKVKLINEIEEISKSVVYTDIKEEAEVEAQQNLIKMLEEDLQVLEKDICKTEIAISKLLGKGADFVRSFNRLIIEAGEPSQKLEAFGKKYEQEYLKEKHKMMSELLASKTTECRQALKEFHKLEKDLEALKEESESRSSKLKESLSELEVHKTEFKKIQKNIAEEDTILNSRLNYYRDRLLEYENQSRPNLEALERRLEALRNELQKEKGEYEARKRDLEQFFEEVNTMVFECVKHGVEVKDENLAKYKANVEVKNKQIKHYRQFLEKQSAELDKITF